MSQDKKNKSSKIEEEYRLVLVNADELNGTSPNEISIPDILKRIWSNKKQLYKLLVPSVIIGLVIAIASPVKYSTSISVLPQLNQLSAGAAGSLLKQYGGLLGIGGGLDMGENIIPPTLYPDIVNSLPFQLELLNSTYQYENLDTSYVLFDYYMVYKKNLISSKILKYSLGLPGVIKELLVGDEAPAQSLNTLDSVIYLTKEQYQIVEDLRGQISVNVDEESGVVKLGFVSTDQKMVTELAQNVIELLTKYIVDFKIKKVNEDLQFATEQMHLAQERFENAQNELAAFQDSNFGNLTAKARTKEMQLQSKYNLTFDLYNLLTQQVEQSKIKVQEQTPIFTIIHPIQKPFEKSSPKRLLTIITFAVLAFIIYCLVQVWHYMVENKIKLI